MSVADKIIQLKDDFDGVYDKGVTDGKQFGYDEFWDVVQDFGNRENYMRAFAKWGGEILSPKYKVMPTGNNPAMFSGSKIKYIDKEKFDLSQATYLASSSSSTTYCLCEYCNYLEVFPDINLQAGYYANAFSDCFALHTIEILRTARDSQFGAYAFRSCRALQNITIDGEIGYSFDIHWSTLLTRASIESIINHLSDTAGATLTLSKEAIKKVYGIDVSKDADIPTDNDFYTLRFLKSNWTFAYV